MSTFFKKKCGAKGMWGIAAVDTLGGCGRTAWPWAWGWGRVWGYRYCPRCYRTERAEREHKRAFLRLLSTATGDPRFLQKADQFGYEDRYPFLTDRGYPPHNNAIVTICSGLRTNRGSKRAEQVFSARQTSRAGALLLEYLRFTLDRVAGTSCDRLPIWGLIHMLWWLLYTPAVPTLEELRDSRAPGRHPFPLGEEERKTLEEMIRDLETRR